MSGSNGLLAGILVGVYLGVNMIQVPDLVRVGLLCSKYNITRIRLPEVTTKTLYAFEHLDIDFTFDISNVLLKKMNDNSIVEDWFNTFVKPYNHSIKLKYIVVGEDGHTNILPTMKVLRTLLNANNLTQVKLTTIIDYTSLISKDPPSRGAFPPNMKDNMRDVLNFLAEQDSPELMVNLYPFKKYVYDNNGVISIDYATFDEKADTVKDGPFIYHNLFDAMVDTIYAAIDKLGDERLNKVNVVIGETGWPTDGRGNYTSIALASKYNQNLVAHLSSGKGTPRRPNVYMHGFIRSLFNEDARPNGESQYYGLFTTDYFTPIYPLFPRYSY